MNSGVFPAAVYSFQPTYEGLKPTLYALIKSHRYCFQPTYEGLKPSGMYDQTIPSRCFQPTYEGLKLDQGVGLV